MKIKIKVEQDFDAHYLSVTAQVRYWEDTEVNGIPDTERGDNIPCKKGELWEPLIELDSGKIVNWKKGVEADIHYKVCDQGNYALQTKDRQDIVRLEESYVPNILCPERNGHGDYIIMNITKDGYIKNWEIDLHEFTENQD